jgi:hypothetical protein
MDPEDVQLHDLCATIEILRNRSLEQEAMELPLLFTERHLRHSWDIISPGGAVDKFYRFFRLTSASEINGNMDGLDAVGVELFGDIHEM